MTLVYVLTFSHTELLSYYLERSKLRGIKPKEIDYATSIGGEYGTGTELTSGLIEGISSLGSFGKGLIRGMGTGIGAAAGALTLNPAVVVAAATVGFGVATALTYDTEESHKPVPQTPPPTPQVGRHQQPQQPFQGQQQQQGYASPQHRYTQQQGYPTAQ